MMNKQAAKYAKLDRFVDARVRAVSDAENERRFELSFSSEEPYERWFGVEILDHSDGAPDLSRLNELGVVLFNHNRDYVVGKIISARVENGRGVAEIEFDTDEAADKIRQKVANGTLKGVSVGYKVNVWEDVESGQKSIDGRFEGPVCIAKRWEALEVSIVSVPADATVGVGRELLPDGFAPRAKAKPDKRLAEYQLTISRNLRG